MPYTHEDYHRDFGPGFPDFYTTPEDPTRCKNLNVEGATPCWHPHCDCQPSTAKPAQGGFIVGFGLLTIGLAIIGGSLRFLGVF